MNSRYKERPARPHCTKLQFPILCSLNSSRKKPNPRLDPARPPSILDELADLIPCRLCLLPKRLKSLSLRTSNQHINFIHTATSFTTAILSMPILHPERKHISRIFRNASHCAELTINLRFRSTSRHKLICNKVLHLSPFFTSLKNITFLFGKESNVARIPKSQIARAFEQMSLAHGCAEGFVFATCTVLDLVGFNACISVSSYKKMITSFSSHVLSTHTSKPRSQWEGTVALSPALRNQAYAWQFGSFACVVAAICLRCERNYVGLNHECFAVGVEYTSSLLSTLAHCESGEMIYIMLLLSCLRTIQSRECRAFCEILGSESTWCSLLVEFGARLFGYRCPDVVATPALQLPLRLTHKVPSITPDIDICWNAFYLSDERIRLRSY